PFLIIFQRPVLDDRLARLRTIRLLSGAHEFKIEVVVDNLCRSEIPEHIDLYARPKFLGHRFSQPDTAAYAYEVYIFRLSFQEQVPDIAAYHIRLDTVCVCNAGDDFENGMGKRIGQVHRRQIRINSAPNLMTFAEDSPVSRSFR